MELINRTDIQKYAKKNTSPKMPIEEKYVYAFIDSLLNSTSVQDVYRILSDELQNNDSYIIYNSYATNARNINKEPYRSIIAYAMLKKDFRLFELISASMFTGSLIEYHGNDLYENFASATDETPTPHTDSGIYTDMSEGLIQIGFKNYYCSDPLPDGTGSEYQTLAELENAILDFDVLITLTKPARVEVLLFYVPWMFMSGDSEVCNTCGIDREDENFSTPFGDPLSMNVLASMSLNELKNMYSEVSMYDYEHGLNLNIESIKTITTTENFVYFDYDFKCQASSSSSDPDATKDIIWGTIRMISDTGSLVYARKFVYKEDEQYYERYNPIMLKINDDDPSGPCLALEIEDNICTVGAMFYVRDTI